MIAIQCLRLFDGEAFSPGPATVLVEENRIVAVEPGFPALGGMFDLLPPGAGVHLWAGHRLLRRLAGANRLFAGESGAIAYPPSRQIAIAAVVFRCPDDPVQPPVTQ